MVVLSFLESIKDTASRMLPTPYMDIMEDATQPHLALPKYDGVAFLCESADTGEDTAVDVVRAVRRRITDDDPKVKYLTVLVLDALIKGCGRPLHLEVASQKGLLRDLQNIATHTPCITEKERMAKEAALALILNMSIWFTGHPDGRVYILTTISDDVRHAVGPNAFEGINPDTNTHVNVASRRHHQHHANSRSRHESRRHRQQQNNPQQPVVDAIGINYPTEEELAAMLDCCMTLAEYLNNAKVLPDGSIEVDDVIRGFREKIQADHGMLTVMLSSDLQLPNRDVLRDISDSQSNLVQRLENNGRAEEPHNAAQPPTTDVAVTEEYRPQVVADAPQAEAGQAHRGMSPPSSKVEPEAVLQQREASKAAEAALAAAAPNVIEDLFGQAPGTDAPQAEAGQAHRGMSPPSSKVEPEAVLQQREASKAAEAALAAAAPNVIEDLFGQAPGTEASAPMIANERELETAEANVVSEPVDERATVEEQSEPQQQKEQHEESLTQQEEQPSVQQQQQPEQCSTGEDDFDAFLEGRLAK
ncbi:hypothetical protein DQ04_06251000 [Trypanosoma grayi]|uniref:hypothetical protein n=1 Tax=Trypanosoma grayi TaxID=71804 RepID=UPI0004F45F90|nr:hypothetical protein DQ04_06251000 [Trypanosoma grayi]KEG08883.1 hypothetical protein DQ04_06251000 [Trypanosoma grayi]